MERGCVLMASKERGLEIGGIRSQVVAPLNICMVKCDTFQHKSAIHGRLLIFLSTCCSEKSPDHNTIAREPSFVQQLRYLRFLKSIASTEHSGSRLAGDKERFSFANTQTAARLSDQIQLLRRCRFKEKTTLIDSPEATLLVSWQWRLKKHVSW